MVNYIEKIWNRQSIILWPSSCGLPVDSLDQHRCQRLSGHWSFFGRTETPSRIRRQLPGVSEEGFDAVPLEMDNKQGYPGLIQSQGECIAGVSYLDRPAVSPGNYTRQPGRARHPLSRRTPAIRVCAAGGGPACIAAREISNHQPTDGRGAFISAEWHGLHMKSAGPSPFATSGLRPGLSACHVPLHTGLRPRHAVTQ